MKKERRSRLNELALWAFPRAERFFSQGDDAKAERRGERLGDLWFRLDRKHRERTYANLALAFPEWSERERDRVAREQFRHFGRLAADFLRARTRTDADVLASCESSDVDRFRELFARGKGVIALTAHFGNWERFGHYAKAEGHPITVVARAADDSSLEGQVSALRSHAGIKTLLRGDAAKGILRELRAGHLVGLLPDQNSDESFVPFFGQPAGTVLGPGVLHLRTQAPLLPAYCVRTGVGRYRVMLGEPIEAGADDTPETLAARGNLALEKAVREYPEQYLWLHDRWKSARKRGLVP